MATEVKAVKSVKAERLEKMVNMGIHPVGYIIQQSQYGSAEEMEEDFKNTAGVEVLPHRAFIDAFDGYENIQPEQLDAHRENIDKALKMIDSLTAIGDKFPEVFKGEREKMLEALVEYEKDHVEKEGRKMTLSEKMTGATNAVLNSMEQRPGQGLIAASLGFLQILDLITTIRDADAE